MLNLVIDPSQIESSFDRIAMQLFNDYVCWVGDRIYQFTELEFYYNNYEQTKDNFAHVHHEEYPNGTWRVHAAGIDIVLKQVGRYYGGILIRGIQALDTALNPVEMPIDGPWNSLTALIRGLGGVEEQRALTLKNVTKSRERKFIKSPRVGLFLKKKEDLDYFCKPWRYTTVPLHTKNYRHLLFLQLHLNQQKGDEKLEYIIDQLRLSKGAKKNYLDYFEQGASMGIEDLLNSKRSVAQICQLFGKHILKS